MIRRKNLLGLLAVMPLVWGLSGCGGGGGAGAKKTPPPAPPVVKEEGAKTDTKSSAGSKGSAPKAEPTDVVEGWGTIKGRIVFDGTAPTPAILVKQGDANAKDAAVCAAQDVVAQDLVVNGDDKGIKWVAVYLGGKPKVHPDMAKAEGSAELGQEGCHFIPHILTMRQGQKFVISSNDAVSHNTNGQGFKNPPFNPIVPPATPEKKSEQPGPDLIADSKPIKVACNIHGWMSAYIFVFDHPYYALTDDNGAFEIKNVPAGTQNLVVWQEKIGHGEGKSKGKEISVKAGETTDLGDISMKLP